MSEAVNPRLVQPASLKAAAQAAVRQGHPLVVMTTLKGCPFCDVVRDQFLQPALAAGRMFAVQVDVRDRQTPLQDFAGSTRTGADMAREWKARFAPTVLFLDAQGREIAERLVGVTLIEFYDQYLWQRIGQAQTKLTR
jgi:thioredoxin-related protein